jgi:hypothetical protein
VTESNSDDCESAAPSVGAEDERLWSHLLHEDEGFFARGNLFLVAHSMLIGLFGSHGGVRLSSRSQ